MPSFTFVSNLPASGDMGRRIREQDWSKTSLGASASWPASLRAAIEIVLLARVPSYVVWGPNHQLLYNDAYAAILGSRHPRALGLPVADVWPESWEELRPAIEQARSGHPSFVRDRRHVVERGGISEAAYFTRSYVPLFEAPGVVGGVFCICLVTTPETTAKEKDTTLVDDARLKELLQQAPSFMTVLRGPDHVFEVANERWLEMLGRDIIGKPIRAVLPELREQGYFDLLDRAYRTGDVLVARHASIRFQRRPGRDSEERIIDFFYQPIRAADGSVAGIFVHGTDVTDIVRTEERRQSTIDALPHQIAVIDTSGTIISVNRSWREQEQQNGTAADRGVEGVNYIEACDRSAAAGDAISARIADMIREVISRSRESAEHTYRRDDADRERWFRIAVRGFQALGEPCIVLTREDVTEQRRHEKRIAFLTTHDQLTGLANRALLRERIEQAIVQSQRTGLGLVLLLLGPRSLRARQ